MKRVSAAASRRTLGGLIAILVAAGSCLYVWFDAPVASALARGGLVATFAALGLMAWQLVAHLGVRERHSRAESEGGGVPSIVFHRRQIERLRDYHRGWTLWSRLIAFPPGPIVFFLAFAAERPDLARSMYGQCAMFVLLMAAAVPVNRRIACRYQIQLDELDNLRKDGS